MGARLPAAFHHDWRVLSRDTSCLAANVGWQVVRLIEPLSVTSLFRLTKVLDEAMRQVQRVLMIMVMLMASETSM